MLEKKALLNDFYYYLNVASRKSGRKSESCKIEMGNKVLDEEISKGFEVLKD